MNRIKTFLSSLLVGILSLAMLVSPASAQATQVTSTPTSVALSMTIGESLSLSATPANISFTYSSAAGGSATASGPITVSLVWSLQASHNGVAAWAWFSSPTAALSGPSSIPASQVFASTNGGAVGPCTQNPGSSPVVPAGIVTGEVCGNVTGSDGQGNGLQGLVFYKAMPAAGSGSGSSTVLLSMQSLGSLTPGTFAGTLNLVAEAF